jgi:hypothetical protein
MAGTPAFRPTAERFSPILHRLNPTVISFAIRGSISRVPKSAPAPNLS